MPESVIPEQVRLPQQGEAPRYPEDIVIGSLGPGEASLESFRFTQNLLRELLQEESGLSVLSNLASEEAEKIISILDEIEAEKVRVGGGRKEVDGSVSFLLRFIGTKAWSGGEMYIRQNEDVWNLEDLILDKAGEQNPANNSYRFDFPPYERFF
jgi:hypothetical protein